MKKQATRNTLRTALFILLPVLTAVICLGVGRYNISPTEVVRTLWQAVTGGDIPGNLRNILLQLRLPRILLALLCGAGLSVSGTAFQSLFSNPLATPDTLGVAAGASFGAALALFFRGDLFVVQLVALFTGIIAVVITYLISREKGQSSITMVVLSGMIVSSLFSALVSLVKFMADTEQQLPAITYWLMGSLANANYHSLFIGAPPILVGILLLYLLRWRLNILTLSEEEATAMGLKVKTMRILVAVAATLITSSCVAMCGQVGWVGLLIPHICRMLFGSNNQRIVPASISLGAVFLLVIDTMARSISAAEIPISILTAIIGAPFFIALLRKTGGAKL